MKYTNARYPDKINDLMDNDGNINPEIIPPAPSGGTKLYKHNIVLSNNERLVIINTDATPINVVYDQTKHMYMCNGIELLNTDFIENTIRCMVSNYSQTGNNQKTFSLVDFNGGGGSPLMAVMILPRSGGAVENSVTTIQLSDNSIIYTDTVTEL